MCTFQYNYCVEIHISSNSTPQKKLYFQKGKLKNYYYTHIRNRADLMSFSRG